MSSIAPLSAQDAGAALEVWYRYGPRRRAGPPARRRFHEFPLVKTPHVSGWTDGMLEARAALIAETIRRVARGEAPENAVTVAP